MAEGKDPGNRTGIVEKVGEIFKTLNPSTIGTLLFVIDDTITLQKEMADKLSCSPSPVTTSLQSLENLPVPLVEKQGSKYTITPDGETVIDILDRSILRLGMDLCDVNWGNGDDKERLGSLLEPLYNSRSLRPFFVLNSISRQVTFSNKSQTIQIADVVSDVRTQMDVLEEGVSGGQIQWTLGRFNESGVIELDNNDKSFTVKEKGREHVRMFNQIVNFLETSEDIKSDGHGSTDSSTKKHQENMEMLHKADEGQTIVPAYCLASSSSVEKPAVLPFTPTITIDGLFEYVRDLRFEYGGDTELELNWVVWAARSNHNLSKNN